MSFVINHRVNDKVVNNFYEKVNTSGSAANFASEAPGRRALIRFNTGTLSDDGSSITFDLPFNFLLNENQLEVYWQRTDPGLLLPAPLSVPAQQGFSRILDEDTMRGSGNFDADVDTYYIELSSSSVQIFNPGHLVPQPFLGGDITALTAAANNSFLFAVPFTSLPAASQDRIIVKNQGDNVGVELTGQGDGILMTSRLGKRFLIQIDEGGNLSRKEL